MKTYHYLAYHYHRLIRRFHKRPGKWQTAAFEHHHKAMRHHKTFIAVLLLGMIWLTPTQAELMSDEQLSIKTAQKLIAATVKIEPSATSQGSGFFVAPDLILTNYHVVKSMNHTIRYSNIKGESCSADIVRQEEYIDLALYRTACTNDTYLALQETTYAGQTVMVAGNPAGYDFTVSKGIVSALRNDWVQFDAKVNYGSSGGVVANLSGEVIGVSTSKSLREENINFAIPASRVNQFFARAKE